MRLLVVSQYFWPEDFRINDITRELVRRGHDVTVLCGTPNYPSGKAFPGHGWFRRTRERWEGVEVVRVPQITRGSRSRLRMAANYVSYALMASLLGPFRCRGSYDAILVFQVSPATMGIAAVVMKLVKKAPIFYWLQDLWPEALVATEAVRARWLLWSVDMLVRGIYRASNFVLIQSRSFRGHVESRGIRSDRILYLPNTAEPFYVPLTNDDAHPALAAVPRGFRVMFAGNIGSVQALPTILSAAELTRDRRDVQWIIVGDGSMRAWVAEEVRKRGLSDTVHLLGRFPPLEMPRLFAGVDALLVTLRRDPVLALTIPSKVQSYLAAGKPIVGSLDGEGAAIIREAGAGLCGPAEDAKALAAQVLALHSLEPCARVDMGRRGREYFLAQFRDDMLIDRLEGWFTGLASKTSGEPA
jgi:glycosyltransferase involved in cell wall biosynthesis